MQAGSEHALEDHLERYSVGTLLEADEEILEEHLLICPACQERLTEIDDYVRAVRSAASILRAEDSPNWRRFRDVVPAALTTPRLAWAGGAVVLLSLLLLASGYWHWSRATSATPVTVVLQAARGAADPVGAKAPRGSPLELGADLSGLPPANGFRLEVVNTQGVMVQRSSIRLESGRWSARVPDGLARGRYWVRLYASDAEGELLREYALRVE
jgi:hypothetical protein